VVPLLAFAYFMASLERANLGIAALSMNKALGLTQAAFGLAAGLYFIGYFFFEVPSNLALSRWGARKWLGRIALTWGVVATLTALVQGPTSLYVMRILLGIAEAGLFPGVAFYFTLWFPARERGKMLALFVVGGALSGIVGPLLSGAILEWLPNGILGLEDWRALFVIEGLPSIIVGILIWRFLVDRPEKARWLTADEKTWLTKEIDADAAPHVKGNPLRSLLNPKILLLSFSYFCKNCSGYVLIFFMPLILKQLSAGNGSQYSTWTIAMLTALPAVVTLFAAVAWAAHSDKKMERQWHSALPLLLAAAGIIAGAATSNPFLLMGALIAATVGVGSMSGAFFQLPPLFLSGSMVAVGIAAINATGNLGGFVGPYVFGILQDSTGSSLTGYVLLAALLVVGAGVILLPMFRRTDTPRSVPASAIVVADPASAEVALAGLEPPVSDGR
jgi:MFS family permease